MLRVATLLTVTSFVLGLLVQATPTISPRRSLYSSLRKLVLDRSEIVVMNTTSHAKRTSKPRTVFFLDDVK